MKKIVCFVIALCLLGGAMGCPIGVAEDAAGQMMDQRIDSMLPALDSIMRVMRSEERTYDPADPEFFWSVLYYMTVNFGYVHPLFEQIDYHVVMPRRAVQEYATAAFFQYDDLLPLPADMTASVEYDASLDAYRFSASDIGDSWTQVDGYSVDPSSHSVSISVGMYAGEGEKIDSAEFILRENPYVSGIFMPIFYYSVESVMLA